MNCPFRTGRRPAFGLLAILLLYVPATLARAEEAQDTKKEIAEVEKQIADLQKKLEELKNSGLVAPGPGIVPESAVK
ncbi:MAG TPA: hypothetical protein VG122_18780, partial [Gemmata sp.]|nr:hypothetical protein [Gemmata sp.]